MSVAENIRTKFEAKYAKELVLWRKRESDDAKEREAAYDFIREIGLSNWSLYRLIDRLTDPLDRRMHAADYWQRLLPKHPVKEWSDDQIESTDSRLQAEWTTLQARRDYLIGILSPNAQQRLKSSF